MGLCTYSNLLEPTEKIRDQSIPNPQPDSCLRWPSLVWDQVPTANAHGVRHFERGLTSSSHWLGFFGINDAPVFSLKVMPSPPKRQLFASTTLRSKKGVPPELLRPSLLSTESVSPLFSHRTSRLAHLRRSQETFPVQRGEVGLARPVGVEGCQSQCG